MASGTSWKRKVVKACMAAGWRKETGGQHTKLFPPDGSRPVILKKGTFSTSGRGMENVEADLRRRGIEL